MLHSCITGRWKLDPPKPGLHLLSKLSPGAKREGEGAQRRKSRNEGELRVAGSLSCEKNGESEEMKREL